MIAGVCFSPPLWSKLRIAWNSRNKRDWCNRHHLEYTPPITFIKYNMELKCLLLRFTLDKSKLQDIRSKTVFVCCKGTVLWFRFRRCIVCEELVLFTRSPNKSLLFILSSTKLKWSLCRRFSRSFQELEKISGRNFFCNNCNVLKLMCWVYECNIKHSSVLWTK